MTDERVIGVDNKLPWHLPADMKWFRKHTLGKPVILGRKTFDSFGGKPLPERKNIIITGDRDYRTKHAVVTHSLQDALRAAGDVPEVMIIGGTSVYAQALGIAQRLYVTIVHTTVKGDAYFPAIDFTHWAQTEKIEQPVDEKNKFACTFYIYEKRAN